MASDSVDREGVEAQGHRREASPGCQVMARPLMTAPVMLMLVERDLVTQGCYRCAPLIPRSRRDRGARHVLTRAADGRVETVADRSDAVLS